MRMEMYADKIEKPVHDRQLGLCLDAPYHIDIPFGDGLTMGTIGPVDQLLLAETQYFTIHVAWYYPIFLGKIKDFVLDFSLTFFWTSHHYPTWGVAGQVGPSLPCDSCGTFTPHHGLATFNPRFLRKEPHELCVNVASKRLHAEILSEQILSEQTLSSERMTRSKPTRKFELIRVR